MEPHEWSSGKDKFVNSSLCVVLLFLYSGTCVLFHKCPEVFLWLPGSISESHVSPPNS